MRVCVRRVRKSRGVRRSALKAPLQNEKSPSPPVKESGAVKLRRQDVGGMHRGVELHGCGTVPRTALGERATRSALQRLQIRAASPSRADFGSPCRLSDNARNGCARRRVPVARRATALLLLLPGPPPNKINDLDGVLAALAAVVSGSLSRIAGSRYSAARRQGSLRQPDTEQSRPARRSFLRWAGSKFRCTSSNIQVFCDEGLLSFLAAWDSRTGPKTAARRSDGALDQRPLSGKELAQNLGQLAPQRLPDVLVG